MNLLLYSLALGVAIRNDGCGNIMTLDSDLLLSNMQYYIQKVMVCNPRHPSVSKDNGL